MIPLLCLMSPNTFAICDRAKPSSTQLRYEDFNTRTGTSLALPQLVASRDVDCTLDVPMGDERMDMTNLPPRYLRTPEAARFVGLSGRTLEKHRTYGTGPIYSKLGGRIVYAIADLMTWVRRGTRTATDEVVAGTPGPARRHVDDGMGRP